MIEYHDINGELVEWEVVEGERDAFFRNPSDFPAYIQKKYLGISEDEFSFFMGETGEVPEGHEERYITQKNPFNGEERRVRTFYDFREELKKGITESITTMHAIADDIRERIVGKTSAVERDGWTLKAQIAQKVLAGTASEEEIGAITLEASLRDEGESIEDLAKKQIEKSKRFTLASVTIDGFAKQAKKKLNACKTPEELEAVKTALLAKKDELEIAIFS